MDPTQFKFVSDILKYNSTHLILATKNGCPEHSNFTVERIYTGYLIRYQGIHIGLFGPRRGQENDMNIVFDGNFEKFQCHYGPYSPNFCNQDFVLKFGKYSVSLYFLKLGFRNKKNQCPSETLSSSTFPAYTKRYWIDLMCFISKGTKHDKINAFVSGRWAALRTLWIGNKDAASCLNKIPKEIFKHILFYLPTNFFLKLDEAKSRKRKVGDLVEEVNELVEELLM